MVGMVEVIEEKLRLCPGVIWAPLSNVVRKPFKLKIKFFFLSMQLLTMRDCQDVAIAPREEQVSS